MSVREATLEDMPTIGNLIEEYRREYQQNALYEPEFFLDFIQDNIEGDDCQVLLLNENQGLMIGFITQSMFSSASLAQEIVWYTQPRARGKGMSLFRAFDKWARSRNVKQLFCSVADVSPAMERLGFSRTEVGYVKTLRTAELVPSN